MSDNISPAMMTLRWDELLELENKWADESLDDHFRLEFDVDLGEFEEEMPIPEQSSHLNSYPVASPVLSGKTVVPQNQSKQSLTSSSVEFVDMSNDDVHNFIHGQENTNTLRKTLGDTRKIMKFLESKGEHRDIFQIPHDELDPLLANFILSVRKPDGSDYEPSSLRNIMSSLDRKLKRHQYEHTIMGSSGSVFTLTRDALKAKQRQLKKQGKGNKPKKSQPIEDEEINILYKEGVLGCSTPQSLLNTMWLNNSVYFGLRGIADHYHMRLLFTSLSFFCVWGWGVNFSSILQM